MHLQKLQLKPSIGLKLAKDVKIKFYPNDE